MPCSSHQPTLQADATGLPQREPNLRRAEALRAKTWRDPRLTIQDKVELPLSSDQRDARAGVMDDAPDSDSPANFSERCLGVQG